MRRTRKRRKRRPIRTHHPACRACRPWSRFCSIMSTPDGSRSNASSISPAQARRGFSAWPAKGVSPAASMPTSPSSISRRSAGLKTAGSRRNAVGRRSTGWRRPAGRSRRSFAEPSSCATASWSRPAVASPLRSSKRSSQRLDGVREFRWPAERKAQPESPTMKNRFKAVQIRKDGDKQTVEDVELTPSDLMAGDVTVQVSHSTVNYKDGLVLTGRSPVVRKFPMIAGIDLAGTVEESSNPEFKPGDKVILNGFGLSETHYGGYAELARVRGEWLVPLPKEFTPAEAMAIGTAGYTAMLSVLALEDAHVTPAKGAIVVTGAAGGVGSVAVSLLAKLGYRVIASTGRTAESGYLKDLGAAEIIPRAELAGEPRMLGKERWAGGIDSVGSKTLANVLASTSYGGAVAACGLAGGLDLPTSVAPFILRGISLFGIDSVQMPRPRRVQAWNRLARDLDLKKLAAMTKTIPLTGVRQAAEDILAGKVRGRLVVEI